MGGAILYRGARGGKPEQTSISRLTIKVCIFVHSS